jgi:hypothetical protein
VNRRPASVVATVVGRAGVVVTQAEEPDQPEDEQPDIEDPEADHEDPPLRAHVVIVPRRTRSSPSSKASVVASSSMEPTT